MSLDPPKVLIELSFLHALTNSEHAHHAEAAALYSDLVDRYEREEVLLLGVGSQLRQFQQRRAHRDGLLAPIDPLHVAFQHRRTARRAASNIDHDLELALTLVICERHRIRTVATFDPRFDQFHLERAMLQPAPATPVEAD